MNNKKRSHWSKSENGIRAYKRMLSDEKKAKKEERLRLKEIRDFEVGQEVILKEICFKKREYKEKVLRVYDKSYKISFNEYDYVLINKESLIGCPNLIVKSITGDGRRYVGSELKLIK